MHHRCWNAALHIAEGVRLFVAVLMEGIRNRVLIENICTTPVSPAVSYELMHLLYTRFSLSTVLAAKQ